MTVSDVNDCICVLDYEKKAKGLLCKTTEDYYKSGANHEQTLRENCDAFLRLRLRPRFLRNVSEKSLHTYVLGQKMSFPVGIAPSAMHKLAHPQGEIGTAKAAAAMGTVMILSTLSTTSIEDVALASPTTKLWFQLYIYKDRDITKNLVKRAERSNYQALVLTIDTPYFGQRLADQRNKFNVPPDLRLANFERDNKKSSFGRPKEMQSGLTTYAMSLFDSSLTWDDIEWLKSITSLPIIVKGILTSEDAMLAVKHGVAGILVSNHGARQLDGVPATIEALPEIVRAANGKCEVYLDGGVRTGTDVLKAIALGARAVFIGRPILWGLACNGKVGAQNVLQILKNEFDLAMGLCGCACIEDIKKDLVVRQEYYSRL